MQRSDQGLFVAARGFTDDVNCREGFKFLAQFAMGGGCVGKLGLNSFGAVHRNRKIVEEAPKAVPSEVDPVRGTMGCGN